MRPGQEGEDQDQLETALFLEALYRRYGADLRDFARAALKDKLDALVSRRGLDSISALQGLVLREAGVASEVLRALHGEASDFLTSAPCFMAMRCAVLPLLRSSPWPAIWLADCAGAELVLRLAALLVEEDLQRRTRLFVTSANEEVLADLLARPIGAPTMDGWDARHFLSGGKTSLRALCEAGADGWTMRAAVREHIVWGQHDLVSDGSFNEFQLVLCQRHAAQYNATLQRRVVDLFGQSLCPFGILQIELGADRGGAALARQFTTVLGEQGLYRRVA